MFCSSGMGLAQSSNYTCGSQGLPFCTCQKPWFCCVTGDKIIPFSLRFANTMPKAHRGWWPHQQELMMGFVWARQGIRKWKTQTLPLDHASRITQLRPQAITRQGCPCWGPESHGGMMPCTSWVLKKICWMKIQTQRSRDTKNYFHLHSLTHSFIIHSLIHPVYVFWALVLVWAKTISCVGKAPHPRWCGMKESQPAEPSHMAHI